MYNTIILHTTAWQANPQKTNIGKTRYRVPTTYAMVPLKYYFYANTDRHKLHYLKMLV